MKKNKWTKKFACIFLIITSLILIGCADHGTHDKNEETYQVQVSEPETATDDFGPATISQIDYDSFQSRMTDEEWNGFQQYFPVLKENASFELTDFENYTALYKNGELFEQIHPGAAFYRYDSKETTDLSRYTMAYAENDMDEMMIQKIRIFDLDGDGTQEMILEWTPAGDILILHCANEKFYGWETVYRGFEVLQTNGVYISSGGAACNSWHHIRFDNGGWIEDVLAEMCWDEYYIGGEAVDEDTFRQQINTYETGDVTGYEPKRHGLKSSIPQQSSNNIISMNYPPQSQSIQLLLFRFKQYLN